MKRTKELLEALVVLTEHTIPSIDILIDNLMELSYKVEGDDNPIFNALQMAYDEKYRMGASVALIAVLEEHLSWRDYLKMYPDALDDSDVRWEFQKSIFSFE